LGIPRRWRSKAIPKTLQYPPLNASRKCGEALFWRTVQLGKRALESFDKNKLVSAIPLTRAPVETCAALWFLRVKLESAIECRVAASIDLDLMRLLMGSKVDQDILPPALNVLSFVDRVEEGHSRLPSPLRPPQ
jgi:hypothetical protein